MMRKYKSNLIALALLTIVSAISHIYWFNPFSILTFSDWYFWPNEATSELWNSWGAWLNYWNLGNLNAQISFMPFKLIWAILTNMGFSYDQAVKITFLIPISFMSFIPQYLLLLKFTEKNRTVSFIVSLVYGSTSYFLLKQSAHIPIAFVYSMTPIIFLSIINATKKNTLISWLGVYLLYTVSIIYEIRITFIMTFMISIYFLIFHAHEIKKFKNNFIIGFFIVMFLNAFWIFPSMSSAVLSSIDKITSRGLFGSNLFDLKQALTIHESSWTGAYPDMNFEVQDIQWYFWILPIVIVFLLLIMERKENRKTFYFFSIVSILGIFLTKQSGSPYREVYSFLYDNFPGFSLYREASKFYILTSFGYTGILAIGLNTIISIKTKFHKSLYYIIILLITSISFLNLKPLITQDMGTLFISRTFPKDYLAINDLIKNDGTYYRTLWVPTYSRWGYYTNLNPKVSAIEGLSIFYKTLDTSDISIYNLNNEMANELLDMSSIKYVIVPIEDKANDDNFFVYYEPRSFYISQLNKLPFLKKIDIGAEELIIYENSNFRPHIYATDEKETINIESDFEEVDHKFINPTEYKIVLTNVIKPFYLNFSENYHPDWRIRIGYFIWVDVLTTNNYLIDPSIHTKTDAGLNTFYIDPKEICNQYQCVHNTDGTYDINLTLYFKPQSYLYLGGIISITTLIGITAYLLYYWTISIKNTFRTKSQKKV